MKLFSNIERIDRQLAHFEYSPDQALSQEALSPIDSMHRLVTRCITSVMTPLTQQLDYYEYSPTTDDEDTNGRDGIDIYAKVLDVGSGFGGPARWMASRVCKVVALELQPDEKPDKAMALYK